MSDYTPNDDQVRSAVMHANGWLDEDAFDRWLEARDAVVRAAEAERCAQIAESLDFGPAPAFSRPAAHEWGARQVAKRIRETAPALAERSELEWEYGVTGFTGEVVGVNETIERARAQGSQATCTPRRGVTQWDSTTERRTK